jgi:hypothetical protein
MEQLVVVFLEVRHAKFQFLCVPWDGQRQHHQEYEKSFTLFHFKKFRKM